jgi:hypothetical protein
VVGPLDDVNGCSRPEGKAPGRFVGCSQRSSSGPRRIKGVGVGLLDMFKKTAKDATDKAGDLAEEHGDKIKDGIEKAGDFVDDKTGNKHSDKIDDAVDETHDVVDDLADEEE